ncbi:MAG TPA: TonB-dependent receptor, partial [Anseongella sp.]|nr:TonB-dependent receptor [Anseongella sp.]
MSASKLLLHLALLLIIPFTSLLAQQDPAATLEGTVTTSDGRPAPGAALRLKGKNSGVATGENGEYRIAIPREGTYTVIASGVGLETAEKTVRIKGPGTFRLDFTLQANAEQLKEVVVLSGRDVNRTDRFAAKIPLTNLENPQIYNTVSSEIMKQQAVVNFDDAMRNVPGIVRTWESTGRAGDGAAYFALRGFDAQPVLYNGLPGLTSGNLDPAGVEEIQVLKGPSGTLFGGSFYSYGGIINTITKKPYFTAGGEAAYHAGSFGLNRVTLDVNAPLSKQERIAMRINAAYHTENSFQDAGFKESFYVAPSLVYQVSD